MTVNVVLANFHIVFFGGVFLSYMISLVWFDFIEKKIVKRHYEKTTNIQHLPNIWIRNSLSLSIYLSIYLW